MKQDVSTVNKRNSNLDLIRLLAVSMVFMVHFGQGHPSLGEWTAVGAKGVLLFFILSGYLVMGSAENSENFAEYIKKRFIRIVPCYYTVLLLIYLWDFIQYTWNWGLHAALSGPCNPLKFLRYFGFLQVLIPDQDYTVWCNRYALWTMSTFAVFYLLAYPLGRLIRKYWQSAVLLLVMVCLEGKIQTAVQDILNAALPYADGYFASHTPISMLYCFLFGTTLYLAVRDKREFIYLGILAGVLIFGQFTWYRFECIFTILLYVGVKAPAVIRGEKAARIAAEMSKESFCFYLCHLMILSILSYLTKYIPLPETVTMGLEVAAVWIGTWLIWYFAVKPVESRFQKILLRFQKNDRI